MLGTGTDAVARPPESENYENPPTNLAVVQKTLQGIQIWVNCQLNGLESWVGQS